MVGVEWFPGWLRCQLRCESGDLGQCAVTALQEGACGGHDCHVV